MVVDEEPPATIEFMGEKLEAIKLGEAKWFGVYEFRRGDLHLRVYRKEYPDKKPARWFGQMSYQVQTKPPQPYNDDKKSRTLLEVDAQGVSLPMMQSAMVRRIEALKKVW